VSGEGTVPVYQRYLWHHPPSRRFTPPTRSWLRWRPAPMAKCD
jgi:hypothetical protein